MELYPELFDTEKRKITFFLINFPAGRKKGLFPSVARSLIVLGKQKIGLLSLFSLGKKKGTFLLFSEGRKIVLPYGEYGKFLPSRSAGERKAAKAQPPSSLPLLR